MIIFSNKSALLNFKDYYDNNIYQLHNNNVIYFNNFICLKILCF